MVIAFNIERYIMIMCVWMSVFINGPPSHGCYIEWLIVSNDIMVRCYAIVNERHCVYQLLAMGRMIIMIIISLLIAN